MYVVRPRTALSWRGVCACVRAVLHTEARPAPHPPLGAPRGVHVEPRLRRVQLLHWRARQRCDGSRHRLLRCIITPAGSSSSSSSGDGPQHLPLKRGGRLVRLRAQPAHQRRHLPLRELRRGGRHCGRLRRRHRLGLLLLLPQVARAVGQLRAHGRGRGRARRDCCCCRVQQRLQLARLEPRRALHWRRAQLLQLHGHVHHAQQVGVRQQLQQAARAARGAAPAAAAAAAVLRCCLAAVEQGVAAHAPRGLGRQPAAALALC
jgi:hypothetical protein